jgi:hypothetical protein
MMGNVAAPTDPNGARLGYLVHPSASVAYLWHAVGTASAGTILTTDTRHAGVATHANDEAMGSVAPIVAVGLRAGSHVAVGTGDAMAWQGNPANGAAIVQQANLTGGTVTHVTITSSATAAGSAFRRRARPTSGTATTAAWARSRGRCCSGRRCITSLTPARRLASGPPSPAAP